MWNNSWGKGKNAELGKEYFSIMRALLNHMTGCGQPWKGQKDLEVLFQVSISSKRCMSEMVGETDLYL